MLKELGVIEVEGVLGGDAWDTTFACAGAIGASVLLAGSAGTAAIFGAGLVAVSATGACIKAVVTTPYTPAPTPKPQPTDISNVVLITYTGTQSTMFGDYTSNRFGMAGSNSVTVQPRGRNRDN